MSNTTLNGACLPPFMEEDLFPATGGYIKGRYCAPVAGVSCCLPCPMTEYRYGPGLNAKTEIASWIAIGMVPLLVFLLLSYAVLPVKFTHRHYMSVCFTLGVLFMEIAFLIPLGANPDQCYNAITPNGMRTDLACAFSGAFILFGGWCAIMWSFLRTLALHLQVCWEIALGPKFMWGALIMGWAIPIVAFVVMMLVTGVSYRFGNVCHINSDNDLYDYWIPILVFAVGTLVLQLGTMAYCIHVYVRALFDSSPTTNSSAMPSYSGSIRTVTARQAYRRVQHVLRLQWRGIALALVIVINAMYFAAIFLEADAAVKPTPQNVQKGLPWIFCLVEHADNPAACVALADSAGLGPNEASLLACLFLLSCVGIWNFALFVRPSIFVGWLDFFTNRFVERHEFVSADARKTRFSDMRSYEMITNSGAPPPPMSPSLAKSPEPRIRSPSPVRFAGGGGTLSPEFGSSAAGGGGVDFGREAKYVRPSMSFSGPRPPSSSQRNRDWDPRATYARGHMRTPSDFDRS